MIIEIYKENNKKYFDANFTVNELTQKLVEELTWLKAFEDNTETELYYSKLVPNTAAPALEGYNDISYELSIVAFNELMIRDSKAIVEGEILDMWVNNYEYYTASDKFEENGYR